MYNCAILEKKIYSESRGTCTDCILHAISPWAFFFRSIQTWNTVCRSINRFISPFVQTINIFYPFNFLQSPKEMALFKFTSGIVKQVCLSVISLGFILMWCQKQILFCEKPRNLSIQFSLHAIYIDIFSISRIESKSVRKKERASSTQSIQSIYSNSEFYGKTATNREKIPNYTLKRRI